jgi:hypothetical protein
MANEETTNRRIDHLYKWLNPDESKEWLQLKTKENTKSTPSNVPNSPIVFFPSENDVKTALYDITQNEIVFDHAGRICELDDVDKTKIINTLQKNNIDITPWRHVFDK